MKALLLDMDGVLVDVSQSYRLAIRKTAEFFLGRQVSDAEVQKLKNAGSFNNDWKLTEALINRKDIEFDKIVKKFQEYYLGKDFNGFIRNERWLLKKQILDELASGFLFGIITGRPREEAEYTLRNSGLEAYFKVLITEAEKPDPLLIKVAMQKLGCKEGFYAGDCVDDMRMASMAGITGIGIANPKLGALLSENGAKYIISDINKIKEVLL